MAKAAVAQPDEQDIAKETARRFLADRAYMALLGIEQPAKLRQVLKSVGVEGVTTRLMRDVLVRSGRFETIDRRWAPSVRFGDTKRPFERIVVEILNSAGVPVPIEAMARELSQTLNRPAEHYEQVLPRMLSDTERFFNAGQGRYGLAQWLLIPTSDEEADVIFDNFLSEEEVAEFTTICPKATWTADKIAETAAKVVRSCKRPVPAKILALIAWREMREEFDPVQFYRSIHDAEQTLLLSDQNVYPASAVEDFTSTLAEMAQEIAALPMEPEEEELEGPVAITDTDKEEIVSIILDRGSASAEELLDAVLEIGPEDPAFAGTLENLNEALKDDERVMFIGGNRWSKVVTFPDEVKVIPESLVVHPIPPFETPEGDIYDQEIEEEGFEGGLKADVYDPLAQDVTDEDPARTDYQPNGDVQRCVLKYHHKMEGTFPLCQINPDFFGKEPEIIPITLIADGKRKQAFVNNSTRLIYGLKDFYQDITAVSGAVFYIERTAVPGEFRFRYEGEVDEQLGIDLDRSLELLDIKARYESQEMPIHDVIAEILERKPGMTFAQLVNEVNIVRRCSRLLVASILSSYHCFSTRGKTGRWQYDEKKRSQGFNKTKRKYIKK